MFKALTEELLDLTVSEKGYRNALYALNATPEGCCGCSSTGSSSLLTCCQLCW